MDFEAQNEKLSLASIYDRYRCPAEVIIPFRMPGPKKSIFSVWRVSRFKKSLWNMDFPWLLVMFGTATGTISLAILVWLVHLITGIHGVTGAIALGIVGSFPIVFALSSPLFYPLSVFINMRMGWGKDWAHTLHAPTHIGITDSGFKFYVRGALFYNYPNLAIWPEIFDANLVEDKLYKTISLRFIYQTGFGRMAMYLPLSGFGSVEDLKFVLSSFANNVEPDNQGPLLKLMSEVDFAPVIDAYNRDEYDELALYHPDNFAPAITFEDGVKGSLQHIVTSSDAPED